MKKLAAVIIVLVLTLIPESCLRQPPNVEEVESFMNKNWESIVLVNNYLLKLGNKNYIALFNHSLQIEDKEEDVIIAIRSLERGGCYAVSKSVEDNSIHYEMWRRTIGEVDCGFVYAIDHTRPPEIQYQTKLVPLSIEGWYYYVASYVEWRRLQNR